VTSFIIGEAIGQTLQATIQTRRSRRRWLDRVRRFGRDNPHRAERHGNLRLRFEGLGIGWQWRWRWRRCLWRHQVDLLAVAGGSGEDDSLTLGMDAERLTADLARHVSNAYALEGHARADALARFRAGFDAEWGFSTNDPFAEPPPPQPRRSRTVDGPLGG